MIAIWASNGISYQLSLLFTSSFPPNPPPASALQSCVRSSPSFLVLLYLFTLSLEVPTSSVIYFITEHPVKQDGYCPVRRFKSWYKVQGATFYTAILNLPISLCQHYPLRSLLCNFAFDPRPWAINL